MDTLRYSPLIIGPDFGAFKDLGMDGLILTYTDYTHLKTLLNSHLQDKPDVEKIHKFIADNSWSNFGNAVYNFIFLKE